MTRCPQCSTELTADSRFCSRCGTEQTQAPTETSTEGLSSGDSLEQERFLPGALLSGAIASSVCSVAGGWAKGDAAQRHLLAGAGEALRLLDELGVDEPGPHRRRGFLTNSEYLDWVERNDSSPTRCRVLVPLFRGRAVGVLHLAGGAEAVPRLRDRRGLTGQRAGFIVSVPVFLRRPPVASKWVPRNLPFLTVPWNSNVRVSFSLTTLPSSLPLLRLPVAVPTNVCGP
ncbi:MAG: zinc-ribbon domain-containing protein [Acidobacteria bacterium]|nr:zinc-ribbon domain-containing protein [Acidobacteriota bacterium]NIM62402.1 zinc-ribbon domain-containing protein [Acidobacteriota bacterium]NIO60696.1 zinc-ribbon domain-containing protein [Acidobacteriota bacterium]NIQ31761.1 zinc-ribbon domain-containing protein [Acidobacteriota bacterium]NIQ87067.1 zinc-ribbon domain-containing protein [Acidobacteriota bacterium]